MYKIIGKILKTQKKMLKIVEKYIVEKIYKIIEKMHKIK